MQAIDIKTNIDTSQAIQNIKSFIKQLDDLSSNTVKTNKDNTESFNSFGEAVQSVLNTANEMLEDFQSQINDFNTDTLNSNIDDSKDYINSFNSALQQVDDISKEAKKELDNTGEAIDDLGTEAKNAQKSIDKLDDELDDLGKSTKGTRLAVEALKDNLGSIPVVGQTLSRALDGVEGSFKSVVLAAAPVAGIAVGLTAVAGTLYGAYKNSEDLRNSLSEIGKTATVSLGGVGEVLEGIGDAIAFVINKTNEWLKSINAVSGASAKAYKELADEVLNKYKEIREGAQSEIDTLNELGGDLAYTTQEKNRIMKESTQALVDSSKQYYQDLDKAIAEASINIDKSYQRMIEKEQLYKDNLNATTYSGLNPYLQQFENAKKVYDSNVEAQKKLKQAQDESKQVFIDSTKELEKFNQTQKEVSKSTAKTVQAIKEASPQELLESNLKSIISQTENYVSLVESSSASELEKTELIKQARLQALNSQKQALTEFAKTQGYDYNKDIKGIADIDTETGKLIETTKKLSKGYDDVDKAIKKLGENKKTFADLQGSIMSILGSISNISNSLISGIGSVLTSGVENYEAYNEAIMEAQQELLDYQNSIKEDEEAESEEDYNLKMERLQEELEKAIAAQDAMSENAIRDKMNELKAEQNKKKEEDKIAKEEAKREEELNKKIAEAEYQKELAVWNNQVKNAETQKNLAIAQAVSQTAFGIAMAGVGTATSFAQGGLVGAAAGAVLAGTIISSIMGAVSGIYSAVQQYEQVKASPPQPPQFATGTSGYTLAKGESAIVGELGAEMVSNMGDGRIAVDTARQTAYNGYSSGETNIFNVYISDGVISNRQDFIDMLMSIKQSELQTVR